MAPQPLPPNPETPSLKLTEHRALIFDVYGTLVDWESAIYDALAPIFPDLSQKEILIKYSRVEGDLQTQFPRAPYSKILELAYRQLSTPSGCGTTTAGVAGKERPGAGTSGPGSSTQEEEEKVSSVVLPPGPADSAQRFGRSIPDWKPFPDTIDALHRLKKHFALVVLSNVDDESFAGTHAQLCTLDYQGSVARSAHHTLTPDSPFSLVLTAQRVGAYRPDPLMLECALRQLSADPDPLLPSLNLNAPDSESAGVLVVANSMRHDIVPAMRRGLHSVWISRHGANFIGNEPESGVAVRCSDQPGGAVPVGGKPECPYTWCFETLGRMADAVEEEVQERAQSSANASVV